MAANNNRENLRDWFKDQRETQGLKDVKFFPGEKSDVSIEQAAERVHSIVTEQCETVDITNDLE